MRPFSAIYYLMKNKVKCALLIFLLFLGYAAYLGGVYVTNPLDNWKLPIKYLKKYVRISADSQEDFIKFRAEVEEMGNIKFLQLGEDNYFLWKSIMGFEEGTFSLTFLSVEDFKTYCEYTDIDCDFTNLKNGSMILSQRFAKNKGLLLGDHIGKDDYSDIYHEFTLDALTDEDGYLQYFITEEQEPPWSALLLPNGIENEELIHIAYELREKYDINIHDGLQEQLQEQFSTFQLLYYFIIIVLALILAVTINAAFVGMYQRRIPEFSIYRAIGKSRGQILAKIVGELLCMDAIALVAGGVILFFGLYLFNQLVLYPVGLYLRYFHPIALSGLILCNLSVILPLSITRCRQMLKADICNS